MASRSLSREWRFSESLNKIYLHGAQEIEWNVDWINKTGGEKYISGILKATNNGICIKVSYSSSSLLIVMLCTTLKPNGKFCTGLTNSLKEIERLECICVYVSAC